MLKTLHKLGLDRTDPVRVGGVEVSPRDVVAACLPDPAGLGDRMRGKTCAGTWVTRHRHGRRARARCTSTTWSTTTGRWREYGSQAVVWQTAVNPVVALELLASGTWSAPGLLGPEASAAAALPRPADRLRLALGPARRQPPDRRPA